MPLTYTTDPDQVDESGLHTYTEDEKEWMMMIKMMIKMKERKKR